MIRFSQHYFRKLLQYSLPMEHIRFPTPADAAEPKPLQPVKKTQYYVRDHHRLVITEPEAQTLKSGILDTVDTNLASSMQTYFQKNNISELNGAQSFALPVLNRLHNGLLVVAPTASGKTLMYAIAAVAHVARSSRYAERQAAKEQPRQADDAIPCHTCGLDMRVVRMCPELGKMHPKIDPYGLTPHAFNRTNCEPLIVIIAPSKELVRQVHHAIRSMAGKAIRVAWFTAGSTHEEQAKNLDGECDIVVSTPAKMYRLWKSGAVRLQSTEMYLFDEIDRLLECTYIDAVQPFLDRIQATRVFAGFFCSTLPIPARRLIESHFKQTEMRFVEVCTRAMITGNLEYAPACDTPSQHHVLMTTQTEKTDHILRIFDKESIAPDSRVIIFCNSARTVNFLAIELFSMLRKRSMRIFSMHQRQTPERREKALRQFQSAGGGSILVTSDVASRGIDFTDVDHVIQFDLPTVLFEYIHRCGRASRTNQRGFFYSLFIPEDAPIARSLLRYFKEVNNPIQVPLKLQEYANESSTERWKRLFAVTAPGARYHLDRARFESHRKPQIGSENALYPDPKVRGLRKVVNPRSFDLEQGIGKRKSAKAFRMRKKR